MTIKKAFLIKETTDEFLADADADDVFQGKRLPPVDESELGGQAPADIIKQFMDSFDQNQFGDSVWQGNMRTIREQVIAVAWACKHVTE
jgi:hypothetical protein